MKFKYKDLTYLKFIYPKTYLLSLSLLIVIFTFSSSLIRIESVDAKPRSSSAGPFSQGKIQVSLGGGTSNIQEETYFNLSGSAAYFIQDGLSLDGGLQLWIGGENTVYIPSIGSTYYLYQLSPLIPYFGVLYEHTIITQDQFEQRGGAVGGRAGLIFRYASRSGGVLFGVGVRMIKSLDCQGDCTYTRPEFRLGVSF